MNQVIIAGHLGADPEVRFTSSGQKVTTLRVAAKARRGGKDETIWWKVTVWGEQFDKMIVYLKKGSPVIVAGDLSKPEIFTDREGRPQVSMNITAQNIMFSPFGRPDSPGAAEGAAPQGGYASHAEAAQGAVPQGGRASHAEVAHGQAKADMPFSEDEIPF